MDPKPVYRPRIAMIGGGTGSFTLLQGLKHATPTLSALVNMSDDGGSTGRLRDELGVLPPGDVRQCLVALSDAPEIRDVFSFRFGEGSLAGHSLGNVILSGLELHYGDFAQAIKVAGSLLRIRGQVIPISLDNFTLLVKDGQQVIRGQFAVRNHKHQRSKPPQVQLDPKPHINPEAASAIKHADLLIIAPGRLYASLLPALAVPGVAEAIQQSKAIKVMVANLMTEPGQTDGWHVVDYAKTIETYIGTDQLDFVLYNKEIPSKALRTKYAAAGEMPVDIAPKRFTEVKAKPIGVKLLADDVFMPDKNDKAVPRTLIRHDPERVTRQLIKIFITSS